MRRLVIGIAILMCLILPLNVFADIGYTGGQLVSPPFDITKHSIIEPGDLDLKYPNITTSHIFDIVPYGYFDGTAIATYEDADILVSEGINFIDPQINVVFTPNGSSEPVDNLTTIVSYEGDVSENSVNFINGAWNKEAVSSKVTNWDLLSRETQEVTVEPEESGIYYYHVRMSLTTGDMLYFRSNSFIYEGKSLDITPPTIEVSGNPTEWTNGDVVLSIIATDEEGGSGIKEITLPNSTVVTSEGEDVVSTLTTEYTITSNNSYTFKAKDNAGNEAEKTIVVNKIDKVKPTLTLTQNPTEPTNDKVTITAIADDEGGSGVKDITLPNGSKVSSTTATYDVTENGTYTFIVTDNAGNTTTESITINNIDKSAPEDPIISINPTTPTNGNVTVTITYPGDAVVKQYRIGSGDWQEYTGEFIITENETVYARCQNGAGTWSKESVLIITNIDKILPTISLTQNPTEPTNDKVTITAIADDEGGSGVKEITLPNGSKVSSTTATYDVTENGTYTFIVTDNAGNTSTESINISNIDKSAPADPIISIYPTTITNQDVTVTITYSSDSTIKQYRIGTGSWTAYAGSFTVDTNTIIYARACTSAGNWSNEVSYTITNIDKTALTIIYQQPANYSLLYKGQTQTISWTGKVLEGIQITEYELKVGYGGITNNLVDVVKITPSGTSGQNGTYVLDTLNLLNNSYLGQISVYVRAKDSSGTWGNWTELKLVMSKTSVIPTLTVYSDTDFTLVVKSANGLFIPQNYSPTQSGITAVNLSGVQVGNDTIIQGKIIGDTNNMFVNFVIDGYNIIRVKVIKPIVEEVEIDLW